LLWLPAKSNPVRMVAAICIIALVVWVTEQTFRDARQIWRTERRRRR